MKKILIILFCTVVFTACGNGRDNSTDTNSDTDSAMVTSTTPPPTSDTTSPIGVMMGDTTIAEYDSVKGGQD